ncbi:MAG: TonB-dependent receptor [Pseudomonadota bacterium]
MRARLFVCVLLAAYATPHARAAVIDEIQVTATRRSSSIDAVPAPVSVIDASVIATSTLLTDALAFAPGVMLQETTPGQGAAVVRGLKGSEVLHLVDGIRLNNAIFRSAPTQYLALVPGASVQRIEVLHGSAAALYGSDAVGGVVNIITRQPQFAEDRVRVTGDATLKLNSADALRAAALTLELADDELAALIAFDAARTGERRIGGGERVSDSGYETYGLRAAVRSRITERATMFADVQLMRQPSTPRVDELNAGFGETQAASAEFFFEPNQRTFVHVGAQIDDGWLGAEWQLRSAWQRIDDDRRTRNSGSRIRTLETNRSDLFHVGVTGGREYARGGWTVGAEWYHDAVASTRRTVDLDTAEQVATQPRFPDDSSLDQAAVFGQLVWLPTDRQTLSAGIRFTDLTADTNSAGAAPLGNTDVSGEVGWLLALTESVSIAANIGRSFRAPNIFDLGVSGARPGNRFNIANGDLQPETAIQYDVGVRYVDDRISAKATLFRLDYRDRIASVPTGELTADGRVIERNENIARAEIVGLELDARYALRDRLSLLLVVNAVRGTEFNPEREPGDRIPPVNGQLRLTWSARPNTQLATGVTFAREQNRLSARDVRDSRINPLGTPGWVSFDIALQQQLRQRWQLDAQLQNVLDQRYRVHGSGVDARGINLALQLRYTF